MARRTPQAKKAKSTVGPTTPSSTPPPTLVLVYGLPEKLWMSIIGDYFSTTVLFMFRAISKVFAQWVRARLSDADAQLYFDSNAAITHALNVPAQPKYVHAQGSQVSDAGLVAAINAPSSSGGGGIVHLLVRGCDLVTDETLKALGPKSAALRKLEIDRRPLQALARNAYASSRAAVVVTDEGMRALTTNAKALQELSLNWCHGVTDAAFEDIHARCPDLQLLSLGWIQVSDKACAFVAQLSRLAVLDFRTLHEVTDAGVGAILEKCTQLRRVTLLDVGVLDSSLQRLAASAAAPQLIELHLSDLDSVTDKGLQALAAKVGPSLCKLNLSHLPSVRDQGVSELLSACTGLKALELNWLAHVGDASVNILSSGVFGKLATVVLDGLKHVTGPPLLAVVKTVSTLIRLEVYGSAMGKDAADELRREARPGVAIRTQGW